MAPSADPSLRGWQTRTFLAVYVTYFTYYLCRYNMPIVQSNFSGVFNWSKEEFGLVFTAMTICYAVGQFVNGQLGDRFGARRISALGALGSVAMNLCVFALAALARPGVGGRGVLWLLIVFWGANGFFQAMGWSPMVRLMAHWFPVAGRGKVMGLLGTCYQFGGAAASLLAITLAGKTVARWGGDWRLVFLVPSVILAAIGIGFFLAVRDDPAELGLSATEESSAGFQPAIQRQARCLRHDAAERLTLAQNLLATLRNPHLWMVAGIFFMLDLNRYGFVNWMPAFIDAHAPKDGGVKAGELSKMMKICIHPLAGSAGALTAGWATDRFFGGRRAPVIVLLLIPLGLFSLLFPHLDPRNTPLVVTVVALVGFCTYGPHILMVGHAAQDFGRKSGASGAAGFIDCIGYVGASLAGWGAGHFIDTKGYPFTFSVFGAAALIGALMACAIWKAGPRLSSPVAQASSLPHDRTRSLKT